MIRQWASSRANRGDDVEYNGGHYVLTIKGGKPAVFHDGQYILFEWNQLQPKGKGWIVNTDAQRPATNFMEYKVRIGVNGEVKEFRVNAPSEGAAKNSAVGRMARAMGVSIQHVYYLLKKHPNSIEVIK